jgi:hypothetical protein
MASGYHARAVYRIVTNSQNSPTSSPRNHTNMHPRMVMKQSMTNHMRSQHMMSPRRVMKGSRSSHMLIPLCPSTRTSHRRMTITASTVHARVSWVGR